MKNTSSVIFDGIVVGEFERTGFFFSCRACSFRSLFVNPFSLKRIKMDILTRNCLVALKLLQFWMNTSRWRRHGGHHAFFLGSLSMWWVMVTSLTLSVGVSTLIIVLIRKVISNRQNAVTTSLGDCGEVALVLV